MQRLHGGIEVARQVPADLVSASAAEFLAELDVLHRRTTVLWHSVT